MGKARSKENGASWHLGDATADNSLTSGSKIENINEERELNVTEENLPLFGQKWIMRNLITWRRGNIFTKDSGMGLSFY